MEKERKRMEERKEKKQSKREQMATGGTLQSAFTERNFVKFYPAYDIDKVKVAFVTKGSNGKGFDVYVDLDKFDLLCDDILTKELARKLAAEQATAENKYPCSWEHITGDSGQKKVRISKGRKGGIVVIFGQNGKETMTVPMSYDELRIMAKWFRRTSAGRFEELTRLTLEGMHRFHFETTDEDEENVSTEAVAEDAAKKETKDKKESDKENKPEKVVTIHTKGEIKQLKESLYVVKADIDGKETESDLYFNADSIASMGDERWERFKFGCGQKLRLTAKVRENDGAYLFLEMAS